MSRHIEVTIRGSEVIGLSVSETRTYIQGQLTSAGIPVVSHGRLWGVSNGQLLHWYDAIDDSTTYSWVGP